MKYKLINTDDNTIVSSHRKAVVAMMNLVRHRVRHAKRHGPKAYCAIRIYRDGKQISADEYCTLLDELERINFNCRAE